MEEVISAFETKKKRKIQKENSYYKTVSCVPDMFLTVNPSCSFVGVSIHTLGFYKFRSRTQIP